MDDIIDVHLRGAFYVSQPAYKVMREQKYARFPFTTSAAGLFGNFGQTNYSAAEMGGPRPEELHRPGQRAG